MEKKGRKSLIALLLLLLLLGVTIGYSILSDSLNINGSSRIRNATWKILFTDVSSATTGSVTPVSAPAIINDGLVVTYEVNLDQPGDFYEFTTTVSNQGSVDARLASTPYLSGITSEQDVYVNYSFLHTDGTAVLAGETINAGESTVYKVKVEYDRNISSSELPVYEQNLELGVRMDWEQA